MIIETQVAIALIVGLVFIAIFAINNKAATEIATSLIQQFFKS